MLHVSDFILSTTTRLLHFSTSTNNSFYFYFYFSTPPLMILHELYVMCVNLLWLMGQISVGRVNRRNLICIPFTLWSIVYPKRNPFTKTISRSMRHSLPEVCARQTRKGTLKFALYNFFSRTMPNFLNIKNEK